jgi:hypothetical protein
MGIVMRNRGILLGVLVLFATRAVAQEYKVEASKEAPPAPLSAAIKDALNPQGYRVVDDKGAPYAEIWLRKGIPATGKPAGPQGPIQFPFLTDGELIGVLRFPAEGHDYRDQSIAKGAYTMRYGLQPVNGDHLGVSTYRDYVLLLPAAKDMAVANVDRKTLEVQSEAAAGSSHPAIFILLTPPATASKDKPSMIHDEMANTWGVVLPLSLTVTGSSSPVPLPVLLIVVGAAAN